MAQDRKSLQRVIKTVQIVMGIHLHREVRAERILKDNNQTHHSLLTLMPSDKRYKSVRYHPNRLQSGFFPQADVCFQYHGLFGKWYLDKPSLGLSSYMLILSIVVQCAILTQAPSFVLVVFLSVC